MLHLRKITGEFAISVGVFPISLCRDKFCSYFVEVVDQHEAEVHFVFLLTNRYTYLLVLESTKIYLKFNTRMLLHVSACDHHQGARN